jgi:hypothetical protein
MAFTAAHQPFAALYPETRDPDYDFETATRCAGG